MTAPTHSRLCRGVVVHTRLRPRRHVLRKRIPMILFDLDELAELDALRLLAIDRFGAFSLETRRHLAGTATPLKTQVERRLAEAGVDAGGPLRLLCMPAVFGQVFNPLSVYFCHRRDGGLAAVLYEVNNTFGARHCYLLPVMTPDEPCVRHGCAKTFHVSPFMDMDLRYEFTVSRTGDRMNVAIDVSDGEGVVMAAAFSGVTEPLSDAALARVLLRHPLLMLEVLGAIHLEALKLILKGIRLRPDPFGKAPRGGARSAMRRAPKQVRATASTRDRARPDQAPRSRARP